MVKQIVDAFEKKGGGIGEKGTHLKATGGKKEEGWRDNKDWSKKGNSIKNAGVGKTKGKEERESRGGTTQTRVKTDPTVGSKTNLPALATMVWTSHWQPRIEKQRQQKRGKKKTK